MLDYLQKDLDFRFIYSIFIKKSMSQNPDCNLAKAQAGDLLVVCCPFCRLPIEPIALNVENKCPECETVFVVRKIN